MADRHFGIGCDQVLIIEPPQDPPSDSPAADFRYRIFNADGGEVEQCGNGLRCMAKFVHDQALWSGGELSVETAGGRVHARLLEDGCVTVDMGQPNFDPASLPFKVDKTANQYALVAGGEQATFSALSLGNPHAVVQVDDTALAPVAAIGAQLSVHPDFPDGVNVGFCQVLTRDKLRLRVYERGAGETLACGTGACAAMVASHRLGLVGDKARLELLGGEVEVEWEGGDTSVYLTGPAVTVFEGEWEL